MQIAIFTDCYYPIKNGVVTSIAALKAGLEASGHQVIILTSRVKDYQERDPQIIRFPSFSIGLGTEVVCALVNQVIVNRILRAHKIEMIHIHTEFTLCLSGILAARKLAIPRVHTTHTLWEEYRHYVLNGLLFRPRLIQALLKLILAGASGLVSPSLKVKNYFRTLLPEMPNEVVPNGMDIQQFKRRRCSSQEIERVRNQWNIGQADKVILFVGRIGREKRVSQLFEAMLPVLRADSGTWMMFVGDGPCRKDLQRKALALGMPARIVFTGYVDWDSVSELYNIADLFVTASLSEVHSMTVIEAMMSALPIVARRDDSYMSSVEEGVNGHLADSDRELTANVAKLLDDKCTLQRFGRESLRISKKFTAMTHAQHMAAFYKRVLSNHPQRQNTHECAQ